MDKAAKLLKKYIMMHKVLSNDTVTVTYNDLSIFLSLLDMEPP